MDWNQAISLPEVLMFTCFTGEGGTCLGDQRQAQLLCFTAFRVSHDGRCTGMVLIRFQKLQGIPIFAQWVCRGHSGFGRSFRDHYAPIFDVY